MSGWFSVKRVMLDHPIFHKRPDRTYIWLWMLKTAAYQDTRQDAGGKPVEVKRGQLLTSYRQIEDATGVGMQVIRTLFRLLSDERSINTDTSNGRLLVTISNYDKYQRGSSQANTATNTEPTQSQHTKETSKQIPPSEGAVAPLNPVVDLSSPSEAVWAVGKAYLARHGVKNPGANIGLWLKSVTPVDLLAAIQAADRARTEDPIPYITEVLKPKSKADSRGGTPQWTDGSMRALGPDRVQEFLFGRWENRSDLTEAMVAEHPKYIGRTSAYRSEAHAV